MAINNKSKGKFEYKGEFYTLDQLSKMSGCNLCIETIRHRYKNGLRDDDLFRKIPRKKNKKSKTVELKSEKYSLLK